jgi:hypothetical protein
LNLHRQEFAPTELSIPGWGELDKTGCRFMDAIKKIMAAQHRYRLTRQFHQMDDLPIVR